MLLPALKAEAKKLKIKGFSTMKKAQLLALLKGVEVPPVNAPAEEEAPAKKKAPRKKATKKKDFGIIKGPASQGSLGPLPFNLVKEFMLEKKDDYDELFFDYNMFRTLKDVNTGRERKEKGEDVIRDFMKEIEIKMNKFPKKVQKSSLYDWDLQSLEMPRKMTDNEIKAYYAKFGFVVEPYMWSPNIYVDESQNPPPRRSIKLIRMEDDAPTKIAKYLGKKEGVKAKVAARYKAQYDKEFDVFKDCYETYKKNVAKIPLTFPPEEKKRIVSMVGSGGYHSL